jgi:hypothetical protein
MLTSMIFYRPESPAQTAKDAAKQEELREIQAVAPTHSTVSRIRAYSGRLPKGMRGVEFDTDVAPDDGSPPGEARWTGPRLGIVVEDRVAKLSVNAVENRQK